MWINEFTQSIMTKLNTLTYTSPTNSQVSPKILYHAPEKEASSDADSRPAISFYQYDEIFDVKREFSDTNLVSSSNSTQVTLKKPPIAWKIYFQFTIATDYKIQEVELSQKFMQTFLPRGYLQVQSNYYDFYYIESFQEDSINYDVEKNQRKETKRIFKKILRYCLFAELDTIDTTTYKKVLDTVVTVSNE